MPKLELLPAVDVRDGQAVRLVHGESGYRDLLRLPAGGRPRLAARRRRVAAPGRPGRRLRHRRQPRADRRGRRGHGHQGRAVRRHPRRRLARRRPRHRLHPGQPRHRRPGDPRVGRQGHRRARRQDRGRPGRTRHHPARPRLDPRRRRPLRDAGPPRLRGLRPLRRHRHRQGRHAPGPQPGAAAERLRGHRPPGRRLRRRLLPGRPAGHRRRWCRRASRARSSARRCTRRRSPWKRPWRRCPDDATVRRVATGAPLGGDLRLLPRGGAAERPGAGVRLHVRGRRPDRRRGRPVRADASPPSASRSRRWSSSASARERRGPHPDVPHPRAGRGRGRPRPQGAVRRRPPRRVHDHRRRLRRPAAWSSRSRSKPSEEHEPS